jgi:hypothetical protein
MLLILRSAHSTGALSGAIRCPRFRADFMVSRRRVMSFLSANEASLGVWSSISSWRMPSRDRTSRTCLRPTPLVSPYSVTVIHDPVDAWTTSAVALSMVSEVYSKVSFLGLVPDARILGHEVEVAYPFHPLFRRPAIVIARSVPQRQSSFDPALRRGPILLGSRMDDRSSGRIGQDH